jgi:hypothetical protein
VTAHVERGRLRNGVGRYDRQGGERGQGQVIDDGPFGARQQRQESASYIERSKEVDGQVLLDSIEIGQIVVDRDAGIVDEDVEGLDLTRRPARSAKRWPRPASWASRVCRPLALGCAFPHIPSSPLVEVPH